MPDDLVFRLQWLLDWHRKCRDFMRDGALCDVHEEAVPMLTEAIAWIKKKGKEARNEDRNNA